MARVSASITPDLLMQDGYNQENMYNLNGTDPGGGNEGIDIEDDDGFEPYDPEWRTNLGIATSSVGSSSVNTSSAAIFPARCPHCRNWIGNSVTSEERMNHIQHILNGCRTFQNQGRYDWRHAAVLNYIDLCMDRDELRVFCDLPSRRTDSEGTVPEELLSSEELHSITSTSSGTSGASTQGRKPNIVFLSRSFSKDEVFSVGVVELTIPWDGRVEAARAEKRLAYSPLVEALSARTRTPVRFISIELGSFNQRLSESSRMAVRELYGFTKQEVSLRVFRARLLKLAELASFHIYTRCSKSEWSPPCGDNYGHTNNYGQGDRLNNSTSSISTSSFLDTPEYLELPESLLKACNEDDKDNLSSESGGGASSGGSIGSTSNTSGIGGNTAASTATSNETSIDSQSVRTDKPKGYTNHNNHSNSSSDLIKTKKYYDTSSNVNAKGQPIALSSRKEDTLDAHSTDERSSLLNKPQNDPVSFGWKTKATIYGSILSVMGYFIYTYWHVILMSLIALFFYEVWDRLSARRKKSSMKRAD